MIGNNYCGDAMLFMPPNKISARVFYPSGFGFTFPRQSLMTPLSYMDLHGGGTSGYGANVMLTFYYVIP